ncbi:hypothetical protein ACSHXC_43420, partial (plasmid) [Streptomyces sp. HUAS TT7]
GANVPDRIVKILIPAAIENPMGVLVIALTVLAVGGIQLVMLFLRQASIPIQALLLPIAGAGQLGGESSRQWLPRLFTAIMVVIIYKPMAALIMAVGFTEMANGSGIVDFIRGVVTLALSVIALKSLLALFAPLGMSMGNAVSSGGGFAGALSLAGSALGASLGSRGGGGGSSTSAADHAKHMDRNGPGGGAPQAPSPSPQDGSSAIQQQSGNIPPQPSSNPESDTAAPQATETAAQTAAAGAQSTATTAAKTAGGPVSIALVAAETGQAAINKAGNTVGGKE